MATLDEIARLQMPFYEAAGDETTITGAALLGEPSTEESTTDRYRRATLRIGPANIPGGMGTMYFYQSPDKPWAYIATVGESGPDGVQCDALNGEAQTAYEGEVCFNNLERSRVK